VTLRSAARGPLRRLAPALCLCLLACRSRAAPSPRPNADASGTRAGQAPDPWQDGQRLRLELQKHVEHWQHAPDAPKCDPVLREAADRALCAAVAPKRAVVAEAIRGDAPADVALPALAELALACERLLARLRFLALAEIGSRHIDADAGKPAARAQPAPAASRLVPLHTNLRHEPAPNLRLESGPLSGLIESTSRLEILTLRLLGAYLEYGPLALRKRAAAECARLLEVHSHFTALAHLLEEAAVLEADPELKARLRDLVERVFGPSKRR
jgi:hypothetical protein